MPRLLHSHGLAIAALSAASLLCTAAFGVPSAAAQTIAVQPAKSTRAFAESVGVNVHLSYLDTAYGNFPVVKDKLLGLGVRWIRDGLCETCSVQHGRLNELAAQGVRAQLTMGTPADVGAVARLVTAAETKVPAVVGAVEGANEWDILGGSTWISTLKAHQGELHRRMKASTTLSRIPVVGPSVVRTTSREALGDITSMLDAGNFHPYPGGLKPGWNLPGELASSALNSGTKPMVAGEIGYHNAVATTTTHPGVSERAAAVYVPRMYLDAFGRGVARTLAFELADPYADATKSVRDRHFGLLRNDFSEKPAYRSLKTLMSLLGDTKAEGGAAGLRYALAGDTTDVKSLLLRGADGAAYLALWQDASVWDRDLKKDLAPAARRVRINLGDPIARAEVYDVLQGTTSVSQYTAPRFVDLDVPAQPIVVKLTPGAVTEPGVDEPAGTGLTGTYFDNADLTAQKMVRVDPWIGFDWGRARPAPDMGYDTFSVRWEGKVVPRFSETYVLHLASDDGARLWIDGRLVLDRWGKQVSTTATASVALTAGVAHDIKLEYFDNQYDASAKLEWSSPSQARQLVPASALFPAPSA
ncbi:MAG: hypothetical protein H0U79_07365 [Solirubrobacterales bacterium]|nr:hypothetical protein [Solirubrobacterales bacterium]